MVLISPRDLPGSFLRLPPTRLHQVHPITEPAYSTARSGIISLHFLHVEQHQSEGRDRREDHEALDPSLATGTTYQRRGSSVQVHFNNLKCVYPIASTLTLRPIKIRDCPRLARVGRPPTRTTTAPSSQAMTRISSSSRPATTWRSRSVALRRLHGQQQRDNMSIHRRGGDRCRHAGAPSPLPLTAAVSYTHLTLPTKA